MKFDPNVTTIGEIVDDPAAYAVFQAIAPPEMLEMELDDFIRGLTWAASSMQIKQMVGVDIYNKLLEKLKEL